MDELTSWLEEWELDLRAGTVGGETVVVYLRSVRQFLAYLGETDPRVSVPADVTPAHVKGWYRHLIEQGRSEATRRVRGIALRLFFGYIAAQADGGITSNPVAGIELPTPQLKPVPVISDDDLGVLLRSMAGNSFVDRRDTAIVRMLLDTGCRRAELVGIDVAQLDLRHKEVTVTGKGSKTRIVPFSDKTALALRKYLRARAGRPQASGVALFLSTRADRPGARMTGGGIAEMITRRCVASGLGHITPHQFRHTWAHDLLSAGAGESDVERLAGWSTPLMVRRYGNSVADQRARDASRRLARGDRV